MVLFTNLNKPAGKLEFCHERKFRNIVTIAWILITFDVGYALDLPTDGNKLRNSSQPPSECVLYGTTGSVFNYSVPQLLRKYGRFVNHEKIEVCLYNLRFKFCRYY